MVYLSQTFWDLSIKDEFEDLKKQANKPGNQKYWQRRNTTLRRQIEIDENEIKCLHEDSQSFALKAFKNYSLCFQTGVTVECLLLLPTVMSQVNLS
jgi:hypothetical protein